MKRVINIISEDDIIGYDALYDSFEKCKKGVRWKGTTAYYTHHWPDEIERLANELESGAYEERKAKLFTVYEPKVREIMSIHFRDRIYQRSLSDNAIFPEVSKSFIPDNFACQPDKGTEPARDRLKEFLHRYYRKYGTDGYVLKIDIKGYYPNMDREKSINILGQYIGGNTYRRAEEILLNMPGENGYNPGSHIVQLVGITVLDDVDHFIKEELRIKYYIRYMDDFILIHHDKEYLKYCLERIIEKLAEIKMSVHPDKTFIQPITHTLTFLGFDYRLTDTGKVLIFVNPEKIKHAKRKIKRMVTLVQKGKKTKHSVDVHFKAYKACVRYGNSHNLIYRLNRWYESLWEGDNTWQTIKIQSSLN